MSARTRAYAVTLTVAAVLVVLALNLLWPVTTEAYDEDASAWVAGLMAFPVAAALVLIHRPDNRVGWALGVVGASAGLIFLFTWYGATFPDGPLSRYVEAVERVPAVGQLTGMVALLYLFPTGRCVTVWFERAFRIFLAAMMVVTILFLLSPSTLAVTGRSNPLGLLPEWLGGLGDDGEVVLLPFALIGIWSLVVRWRRAGSVERAQLKWFLSGAIFALSILFLVNVVPGEPGGVVGIVAGVLVVGAFWSLPGAIVIAVLRYNLYDIDRIINRTLIYGVLTAGLAALYAGLVAGLQALLRPVSGGSDLAIVVTTLVVAALFLPARRRIQAAVDRRFNRRTYDAARTIDAFAARLREQVDLDTLRYELLTVVDETMRPARVSLWLREQGTQR
ncbi:MAG: hypothetical protein ACRDJE_07040 [Dehalococcoidia bacterium]